MNLPEDDEILDLFDQGGSSSHKAFTLLVRKYQELTYWQIRRMVKNHEDSNDIVQNVFIKIYKALPKFKREAALYSWIYRIAYNETIDFISKHKKRLNNVTISDEFIQLKDNNTFGSTITSERIEELLFDAIQTLPEKQALVFQLKYFEEKKYTEISELLNTSVGGLKANYSHAVQKIKDYLQKQLNH